MDINDSIFYGMTPKEKEIFLAVYPKFSKEIVPRVNKYLEGKDIGSGEKLTNEQQKEMMKELMPSLMPALMDMMSNTESVDMFTFMGAISKGLTNLQHFTQKSRGDLGEMLDK
jgi:hypothetical protein